MINAKNLIYEPVRIRLLSAAIFDTKIFYWMIENAIKIAKFTENAVKQPH